ncbi:MAG: TVP38/TMEM64 family protein, partial [Campylobacteraceae bacterium]|nr:TVP38/TMEM64 family protein [Campylobacteraceae bacterium]
MSKNFKRGIVLLGSISLLLFIPQTRNYFFTLIDLFQGLDIEKIKAYILSFGLLAPLVSFGLMVFQSVLAPLPAFLITFANAALFGWVYGAILSWVSAMAGALLCFYIAKILGREVVEKLTSKMALEIVDTFFAKHGVYAILIARLLPFISFDIVSYAAGLTSMRLGSFLVATGIGQLPATLVYSYAGEMLSGGLQTAVYGML